MTLKDLPGVVESVQNSALPSAVGAEKEGDRTEVELDRLSDAFEVLDRDAGNHS
jgi:hypothetical protein